MNNRIKRAFLYALLCCGLISVAFIYLHSPYSLKTRRQIFLNSDRGRSVRSMRAIKRALEHFHQDHGQYPVSEGFSGLKSCWGHSGANWIPGLSPTYLSHLPTDPRNSPTCNEQFLYISDGTGYKLIDNDVQDAMVVLSLFPEMFDNGRQYSAYSIWTKGWENR